MIKSNKRTAYILLGTGAESPNSLEQNGVVLDGKTLKKYPRERRNATFAVPDGVREISDEAFDNCPYLKSVLISKDVAICGSESFFYCPELTTVNVARENVNFCSKKGVLFTKDGKSLLMYPAGRTDSKYKVPEGVERFDDLAFRHTRFLRTLVLSKSVKDLSNDVIFFLNSINAIEVAPESPYFTSKDGVLFSKDGKTLVKYPDQKLGVEYNVPAGVERIEKGAFHSSLVKCVRLPDGCREIGRDAFGNCPRLIDVEIPDTVTDVDYSAFSDCPSLVSISFPRGIREIKDEMFLNCPKLSVFSVPKGVTSIGVWAFLDCRSLSSIYIPRGVEEIQTEAFQRCLSLRTVVLPEGLRSIGERAFDLCYTLSAIEIPSSVKSIGDRAFGDCDFLKIKTPRGSYAEEYAKANGIMCEPYDLDPDGDR